MAKLWIMYSWKDNEQKDVEYLAQQLIASGLQVELDRWVLTAGNRLWDQIAVFIDNPGCNAWMIYATQNSLGSEACKEELAYALDRTLSQRGAQFPIIALFPSSVDRNSFRAASELCCM